MNAETLRILAVEENPADFLLLKECLRDDPEWEIVQAGTLREALRLISDGPFDVVLLDLDLPDTSGFEGLEKILGSTLSPPVIVLTDIKNEEIGRLALSKKALEYLVKGMIDRNILVRSIRYAIGRARAEEASRELNIQRNQLVAERDTAELAAALNHIQENERLIRIIVNSTPACVSYLDSEYRYRWANKSYQIWFDRDLESIRGRHVREVVGEAAWDLVRPRLERTLRGETVSWEEQLPYASGETRWVHATYVPDVGSGGRVVGIIAHIVDITERKKREEELHRLNRTLKALGKSNLAMTRVGDELAYIKEVCRIIVEDCGHAMVWIGFAENDEGKTVRPVASSGFDEGYLDELHITWADTERGRGPTGTAIRTGRPTACRNMLTDPQFAPWRDAAVKRGYASSIVLPFKSGTGVFGALNIYSREPESFADDEVRLLSELADDLASGITAIRLRIAKAKAEEALLESKERLRLAQKAGRVGVFDRNFMTDKILWTDELKAIYGVPLEFEATNHTWMGVVHPDDAARVSKTMERALLAHWQEIESEYRIIRPDKEVRWLEDRALISYDPSGAPKRMIGTTIDITGKKESEEKHRETEQQYRKSAFRLINTLAVSIFVAECVVMVLLSLIHPLSMIVEAIMDGLMMLTLVSPTLYRFVFRPLLRSIKERERAEEALRLSHEELELRVKERTSSLAISNEKLANEIAERKRTERALRESEQRLNRAQEISHLGSWELDLAGNSLSWSDEVYRIFGLQAREFGATYEAFLDAVHPGDRGAVDAAYRNSIRDGDSTYEIEHRIVRRRSGEIRTVHEKCEHIRDASGRIVRSVGMVHDVTPRKLAEDQTLRHLRSLEFISGTATHFLKEQAIQDVYQYVAVRLSELSRDGVVLVNEYDSARKCTVVRAVGGSDEDLRSLSRLFGRGMAGTNMTFEPDVKERMGKGGLTKVHGGLYELACEGLPETLCLEVQKTLGLGGVFVMAFSLEEDCLGTVALLTRGKELPGNARVIETFINQAAVALKRLRTEEERKGLLAEAQWERARAESLTREVKEERSVLDTIMENTKAQLAYLDPDFTLISANSAYAQAAGRRKEELTGHNHFTVFPNPAIQKIFEQVRETGQPVEVVARVIGLPEQLWQGETYWDWTLVPVKSDQGEMQGFAFSRVDVTEHLRRQEEIRRNAEEYRLLMEEASEGILLTNQDGEIFAVNKKFCELLEWKEEDVSLLRLVNLMPEEDVARLRVHLDDLIAGKTIVVEHQLSRKDGTVIDVETNAKMLANGRIQAIVRDITKEKEQGRRLMRVMKEEVFDKLFLKVRAFKHGQSNVMNLSRLAFLMKNMDDVPRVGTESWPEQPSNHAAAGTHVHPFIRFEIAVQEFMTTVAPELEQIASLVMVSGIDAARPNASPEISTGADLSALVGRLRHQLGSVTTLAYGTSTELPDRSFESLRSEALDTIGRIKYMVGDITAFIENTFATEVQDSVNSALLRFEPQHVGVCIDASSVQEKCRVIFNRVDLSEVIALLIQNSLEAFAGETSAGIAKGHTIRILTEPDNEHVRIIVEDDGPGVPDAIRDRVFENGVSGKSGSRGFGLSYAGKCVTKYGGRILLDSGFEQGARFVIELSRL